MVRSHRSRLVLFSAGFLLALSAARADTEPGARAVIRGTGKDVQIVYRAPRPAPPPARPAADPVTEALRQKSAGASDLVVLDYLGRHRDEMPVVIGADALRRFRKAGAGEAVIGFLSTNAAVDIGATAEGGALVMGSPGPSAEAYGGAYPDLVSSGYPFYGGGGGYGGYGPGGWGMRRGFSKNGHDGLHQGLFPGGRFFFGFGSGFASRPVPHPLPARGGGSTHAAVVGGGRRH